jgi:hypothetical protein
MSNCQICCEEYNKTTHKVVQCMYCDYESCMTCCQSYILGETTPKCMNSNCGREWTRKFISNTFRGVFVTGAFKKHKEDVLFDKERALLPATQPYAEAVSKKHTLQKELLEIRAELKKLNKRKELIHTDLYTLSRNEVLEDKKERKQFIKPCPVNDCRGFLSSQYKCGLCETWACPHCSVVIGKDKTTDHTCDPNDVESVKLMKTDTKSCPKCAVPIFKIDGCDQIWCTQCHIAFSFKTGTIENKVHNPHYYEWMRQTTGNVPRNAQDIRCGHNDEYDGGYLSRSFNHIFERQKQMGTPEQKERAKKLGIAIHGLITNISHIELDEIRPLDYEKKNRQLRIKYLLNELDDTEFKSRIQQADKKYSKHNETQDVYRLVVTGSKDIILRYNAFLISDITNQNASILNEIDVLIKYANECICDIKRTYVSSVRLFTNKIRLLGVR